MEIPKQRRRPMEPACESIIDRRSETVISKKFVLIYCFHECD